MGAVVEMADDHPLHHDAEEEQEEGARRDGRQEGPGILVGDHARVAAHHEHRAMGEIEHAQGAVDDREAGTEQREKRAQNQPIEHLPEEIAASSARSAPRPGRRLAGYV